MGTTGGSEVTSPLLGDDTYDGNESDLVGLPTVFKSGPGEMPDGIGEMLSDCITVFSLTGVSLTGDCSPTGLHVSLTIGLVS